VLRNKDCESPFRRQRYCPAPLWPQANLPSEQQRTYCTFLPKVSSGSCDYLPQIGETDSGEEPNPWSAAVGAFVATLLYPLTVAPVEDLLLRWPHNKWNFGIGYGSLPESPHYMTISRISILSSRGSQTRWPRMPKARESHETRLLLVTGPAIKVTVR